MWFLFNLLLYIMRFYNNSIIDDCLLSHVDMKLSNTFWAGLMPFVNPFLQALETSNMLARHPTDLIEITNNLSIANVALMPTGNFRKSV
jgi:hypothetical protein